MRILVAVRNLAEKPLQNLLIGLIVAAAVMLSTVVVMLSQGIQAGLVKATEPFDLIVGAKGSPYQLVLNTVFLQDSPVGNISHEEYEKLAKNSMVEAAVPLGFGDSFRGHRIVGAGTGIFSHAIKKGQPAWLQVSEGKAFDAPFEAVLGAKTAKDLGLKVGDTFVSVHGTVETNAEQHAHSPYTVVGILKPVEGPYDQAILVSIESIWKVHEHGHEAADGKMAAALPVNAETQGISQEEHDHANRDDHEKDHEHDQDHDALAEEHEHNHAEGAVTAVMLKPKGYAEAMRLYQQYQKDAAVQLLFPAQVIVRLFSFMGQGEQVLNLIAWAVLAMAICTVALSVYWSSLSRVREKVILRVLGAKTGDLFIIVFTEGAILSVAATLAGLAGGHGLFVLLASSLLQHTAITVPTGWSMAEIYLGLLAVCASLVASAIPALLTYKADLAEYL